MGTFGDFFGDAFFGGVAAPGSPEDTEQRVYAGPSPWLDQFYTLGIGPSDDEVDPAPGERACIIHAFAFDEDSWEDIEELDGVVDGNYTKREQDHFCEQVSGSLVIDDPDGRYAFDGDKHDLLLPRKLIRLESITWTESGQVVDRIGVYRINAIPTVNVQPDTDVPQYSYSFEDWARERVETQMSTRLYPSGYMMWHAQGYTGTNKAWADTYGQQPPLKLYDDDTLVAAGDALFHGVPYDKFGDVIIPDFERATMEASDWKYTLTGYVFANLYDLLDGRVTVDGTFRDMSIQMAFGKPPPAPVHPAFRARDETSGSFISDASNDPINLYGADFFWGNETEWPTWRMFLQSIYMEDPQTNQKTWGFTWGTFPAKLYYDKNGWLHLAMIKDLSWHGKGFSTDQNRGQKWQLPLESIDRNAEFPEFNRVLIQRTEYTVRDTFSLAGSDPFNPLIPDPEALPVPMISVRDETAPGSAFFSEQIETVTYANVYAKTKWFTWQPALDKPFTIGPNVPSLMIIPPQSGDPADKEKLRKYRSGLRMICHEQAKNLLKIYLARAYHITVSLSGTIPAQLGEVFFVYHPEADVMGYFRIVSIQRRFDEEPQIWEAEWVKDM
jgi:hypothetical protein